MLCQYALFYFDISVDRLYLLIYTIYGKFIRFIVFGGGMNLCELCVMSIVFIAMYNKIGN